MISNALERFQAFLDPLYGSLRIEAYWVKVANGGDSPPFVGPLEQGVSRSYGSLMAANDAAMAFPAFPGIAERFSTEPFTAIADLLDALREVQEWESVGPSAPGPSADLPSPSFEGSP